MNEKYRKQLRKYQHNALVINQDFDDEAVKINLLIDTWNQFEQA